MEVCAFLLFCLSACFSASCWRVNICLQYFYAPWNMSVPVTGFYVCVVLTAGRWCWVRFCLNSWSDWWFCNLHILIYLLFNKQIIMDWVHSSHQNSGSQIFEQILNNALQTAVPLIFRNSAWIPSEPGDFPFLSLCKARCTSPYMSGGSSSWLTFGWSSWRTNGFDCSFHSILSSGLQWLDWMWAGCSDCHYCSDLHFLRWTSTDFLSFVV